LQSFHRFAFRWSDHHIITSSHQHRIIIIIIWISSFIFISFQSQLQC
jgi:hypothetical protein